MKIRTCNKCKVDFPKTKEYFFACAACVDGLERVCKKCRGYNIRKILKEKTCPDCGEIKENNLINFQKVTSSETARCIECRKIAKREQNRKYKEKHKDKVLRWKKEYRERHKEKIRKYSSEYRDTPRGKKVRMLSRQRRRTLEKELISTFTQEQWEMCLNHFNNCCAYCGNTDESMEQDHFVPLSKGGEYTSKNIIPACPSCNGSKFDKSFFDWYSKQEYFSKQRNKKILTYLGYENKKQQISLF